MKTKRHNSKSGISRRDSLKMSGLALGGLALAGVTGSSGAGKKGATYCDQTNPCGYPANPADTQRYTFLKHLDLLPPHTPLEDNEMRISFMGTAMPPPRRAQMTMSVFVEVGPWIPDPRNPDPKYGKATDSFIFDCGAGSIANYGAMNIAFRKMDKIFVNHLHSDHMSDLSFIYTMGASGDRDSPLYVWGPKRSGITCPEWGKPPYVVPPTDYDDGTREFCKNIRAAMRWHSESFSFQETGYEYYRNHLPTPESWGLPCKPEEFKPVGDDPPYDGYAMIPIELDWTEVGGIAYNNPTTRVKITHFPVVHCRMGSVGYKVEWNGLSMIYTSDTRPEWNSVEQASGPRPLDVFIHEMIVPPDIWAMKMMGIDAPRTGDPTYDQYVQWLKYVQESSHTTQGAFGYLLSRINPRPRLTVATHFPVSDDTVACALQSLRHYCPDIRWKQPYDPKFVYDITWSFDCMVLRVFPDRIEQYRAEVSDFSFSAPGLSYDDPLTAKYHDAHGKPDATAQLDPNRREIPAGPDTYCESGY